MFDPAKPPELNSPVLSFPSFWLQTILDTSCYFRFYYEEMHTY